MDERILTAIVSAAGLASGLIATYVSLQNRALPLRRIKKSILVVRFFMLVFLVATPFIAQVGFAVKRNLRGDREKVPCPC